MVISLRVVGAAVLAFAGGAVATKFSLADTYDSTNFFDKMEFMTHGDLNGGFVRYLGKPEAIERKMARNDTDGVYLGADYEKVMDKSSQGRDSFRLESYARYTHGLIVARFKHLPGPACGAWPAFWTLGDDWPNRGEIDMYEGWNLKDFNEPAIHVGAENIYGSCRYDGANQSSTIATSNCDNTWADYKTQWPNQGCVVKEKGSYASPNGGTYALEWTKDYLKLYSWSRGEEPGNMNDEHPDTADWGTPSVNLKNNHCDIDKHFGSQRIIVNVAFCGNPVQMPHLWQPDCSDKAGGGTCVDYVANNPSAFKESYFQIQDIRYFKEVEETSEMFTSVSSMSTSSTSSELTSTSSTSAELTSASSTSTSSTTTASSVSSTSAPSGNPPVTSTSFSINAAAASISVSVPTLTKATSDGNGRLFSNPTKANSIVPPGMTISTVYSTSVKTITSCAPTITACPAASKHVTTVVIPITTIVCPVDAIENPAVLPSGLTVSVVRMTTTKTITSCLPTVTDCPEGKRVTTVEVPLSTIICPVDAVETPSIEKGTPENVQIPKVATRSPLATPSTLKPSIRTALPHNTTSLSSSMKTSVVYTTTIKTITSCPPTVTNCPEGKYVTTVEVPLYTTTCPVDAIEAPDKQSAPGAQSAPGVQDNAVTRTTMRVTQQHVVSVFPKPKATHPVQAVPIPNVAMPANRNGSANSSVLPLAPASPQPSNYLDGKVQVSVSASRASACFFTLVAALFATVL